MVKKRLSMPSDREVLRLKYELGRSHRQIAAALGIGHSTVGVYVRRAKADGDRPVFRSAASFPASRSPIPRSRTCGLEAERVGGSPTLSRRTRERARSPAAARHPEVTVVVARPPFTGGEISRTDRSMRHVARGSYTRSAVTPGTVVAACDGARPRLPPRPT